jgi:hypothetical protein
LPVSRQKAVIAMFIMAIALGAVYLGWAIVLQECVPAEVRGRMVSITLLASNGLLPIGFALAGLATESLGPATLFIKKAPTQEGRTLRRYRRRRRVEWTFAWFGNFRRLLLRWERQLTTYLAFFQLACLLITMRQL